MSTSTLPMSDAQVVLVHCCGTGATTTDDKKAALALAKECRAEVEAIATSLGKSRNSENKWV